MKISEEQVLQVAHLARLEISKEEVSHFADQLGNILDYVDQLSECDTEGVPATSHAIPLTNAFRDDEPGEHLGQDAATFNAPSSEDGSFIVPRVIG